LPLPGILLSVLLCNRASNCLNSAEEGILESVWFIFRVYAKYIKLVSLEVGFCGKGPAMVKTLTYKMAVFMTSSITCILKFQNRTAKIGTLSPMDKFFLKTHCTHWKLLTPLRVLVDIMISHVPCFKPMAAKFVTL